MYLLFCSLRKKYSFFWKNNLHLNIGTYQYTYNDTCQYSIRGTKQGKIDHIPSKFLYHILWTFTYIFFVLKTNFFWIRWNFFIIVINLLLSKALFFIKIKTLTSTTVYMIEYLFTKQKAIFSLKSSFTIFELDRITSSKILSRALKWVNLK